MGIDPSNFTRRHFIAVALAAPSAAAFGAAAARTLRTVLFVCQYGTVKSAVAREVFRRRAAVRGIAVNVISRGITPEAHMSPALAAHLAADGIDPLRDTVQPLDREALDRADIVVIFDPLPQALVRSDARDWTAMPSLNATYDAARAFLDQRIESLLGELMRDAH